MAVQFALTIIGCFVVFSASRTRVIGDPYAFATRQVVFAIIATVVMFVVMSIDYEWWKDRARFLYGLTLVLLTLLFLIGSHRARIGSPSTSDRSTSSRPRWRSSRRC
jgi:cell division protein FtsW (lipid II flippase)